jgi:hypothetical protein
VIHCGETYYYICNKNCMGNQGSTTGFITIGWISKNDYCDGAGPSGSKAWVCQHSLAGIVGLNPARARMSVYC